VGFFFDRKGSPKQKTSNGLYRSLLYQLMEADPAVCAIMLSRYFEKLRNLEPVDGALPHRLQWSTTELKSIPEDAFKAESTQPTIIIIDSIDECDEKEESKAVVKFCRDILRHAREYRVTLNICLSSRSNFAFGEGGHTITLDQLNSEDISTYLHDRIEGHGVSAHRLASLVGEIVTKSAGIFLWARLAMDILLDDRDAGRNVKYSQKRLKELPDELEKIYTTMLVPSPTETALDRNERLHFFQWIIFANRPLKLREWYTVIGMIQERPPSSLKEWSNCIRNPIDMAIDGVSQTGRNAQSVQKDREIGQDLLVNWIQRVSVGVRWVDHKCKVNSNEFDREATLCSW
jgi:hypothetical protein